MKPKYQLKGPVPALVTMFKEDGNLDEAAFREHIDYVVSSGVSGVVILGSMGEFATMSTEERKRVMEVAIDQVAGRCPVVVGTGAPTTKDAIFLTCLAKDLGASNVQVVTPYYVKPSPDDIVRHYQAVSDACDIPITAYNMPGRTGYNLDVDLIERLSSVKNFVAVKDSSGLMIQMLEIIRRCSGRVSLIVGNDALVLPGLFMGAAGWTSGVPNVFPKLSVALYKSFERGDFAKARKIQYTLNALSALFSLGDTVAVIKTALAALGRKVGSPRAPVSNLSGDAYRAIEATVKDIKARELELLG